MSDRDDILRKIRGILAKAADGSGATEAEAASALAFAERLMLRHGLADADLGTGSAERTPEEIAADTEYGRCRAASTGQKLSAWEGSLASLIVETVGTIGAYCEQAGVVRSASGAVRFDAQGEPLHRAGVMFYGPVADAAEAALIYEEWTVTVAALARLRFGGALRGEGRDYAGGFVSGMWAAHSARRRAEAEAVRQIESQGPLSLGAAQAVLASPEPESAMSTALVLRASGAIAKAKQVRAEGWLASQGVRVGGRRSTSGYRGCDAYAAGRRDGANASVSRRTRRAIE